MMMMMMMMMFRCHRSSTKLALIPVSLLITASSLHSQPKNTHIYYGHPA